jgi:hypothetical protein
MAPLFAACALLNYYICSTRLAWPLVGYWSYAERPFPWMGTLLHFGCDGVHVSSIIGELGVGGWVFDLIGGWVSDLMRSQQRQKPADTKTTAKRQVGTIFSRFLVSTSSLPSPPPGFQRN